MTRVRDKFSLLTTEKGFTLIELLIVIVIIGILAGVLIAVIDPAAQQNRARDATVEATLNKMALAVGGFRSAYGRPPDGLEFLGTIENAVSTNPGVECVDTGTDCLFTHTSPLPDSTNHPGADCDGAITGGGAFVGDGNAAGQSDCVWYYLSSGNDFALYGKSFGLNNGVFVYNSTDSEIHQCDDSDWDQVSCRGF
jgi:prepilin-type N-terminal cleavage/methylation domain-containing protein